MKAVVFHKHGGPEVLETGEVQDPEVAPDEVLIEVRAASVNHLDIFVRRGLPGLAPPHSHTFPAQTHRESLGRPAVL